MPNPDPNPHRHRGGPDPPDPGRMPETEARKSAGVVAICDAMLTP